MAHNHQRLYFVRQIKQQISEQRIILFVRISSVLRQFLRRHCDWHRFTRISNSICFSRSISLTLCFSIRLHFPCFAGSEFIWSSQRTFLCIVRLFDGGCWFSRERNLLHLRDANSSTCELCFTARRERNKISSQCNFAQWKLQLQKQQRRQMRTNERTRCARMPTFLSPFPSFSFSFAFDCRRRYFSVDIEHDLNGRKNEKKRMNKSKYRSNENSLAVAFAKT